MYGIFTYMDGWIFMVNVSKYTSPMDGMGHIFTCLLWNIPFFLIGKSSTQSGSILQNCYVSLPEICDRVPSTPIISTGDKVINLIS